MKHYILLIFVLGFFVSPCFGQHKLDSLRNVWDDEKQSDFNRAKALTEYAKKYNKTNADSSLFYAQKAYEFANTKGIEEYKVKSKRVIWSVYYKKGDFDTANRINTEAFETAIQNGDSSSIALAYTRFGLVTNKKFEYDSTIVYYRKAIEVSKALNDKEQVANNLNNIGIVYIYKNDYPAAEACFEQCISLYEELELDRSASLTNLALLKKRKGDLSMAIELFQKQLAFHEKNGDEANAATDHINIASSHYDLENKEQFLEHTYKALELNEKLINKEGIAKVLANLGEASVKYKDQDKALEYLNRSLLISEEIGNKAYIGRALREIGKIQIHLKNYPDAYKNLSRSLTISEEINYTLGIAMAQRGLGLYYKAIGNTKQALVYFNKSLETSKNRFIAEVRDASFDLFQLYDSLGNDKLALESYKLYISTNDSIQSEKNKRAIIGQEFKYEYDKKALRDSIYFESQKEIQNTKLEKTKEERLFLLIILAIVVVASVMLFNRIRLIRKQKNTIEGQNQELNNLNENLEQTVEERTQKIIDINNELKESDERYAYALEAANEGIWDYNVQSDTMRFSPAIYTMLGFEPYEFPESREGIYNLMHSEEQKKKIRKAHQLFIVKNNEEYLNDEYRLVGKNGEIVWIQVKGKIVEKDAKNRPVRIVGTHVDITASKLKNKEMLEAILRTEDAERSRISQDIHDGLQQTLTISFLNFNGLKKDIEGMKHEIKDKFDLGWQYLKKGINESRTVAHTLMPKAIVDYGILPACESLVNDMNNSNDQTEFNFHHNFKSERITNQQVEIALYRILQEALNNITKYAKSTKVDIQLKEFDDIYLLMIEDNGVGFDKHILKEEEKGLGFKSMKNRLDAINGHLEIDSVLGRGTTILVEIDKEN
ncbi:tetratricopeptide repeat protein [Lutibacter holmesii]|uniref:histidine kinase n=1 Tax=Lutibacter holmesii TaxID=1137985 RepID=A0ABW3WJI7_9FLAO